MKMRVCAEQSREAAFLDPELENALSTFLNAAKMLNKLPKNLPPDLQAATAEANQNFAGIVDNIQAAARGTDVDQIYKDMTPMATYAFSLLSPLIETYQTNWQESGDKAVGKGLSLLNEVGNATANLIQYLQQVSPTETIPWWNPKRWV